MHDEIRIEQLFMALTSGDRDAALAVAEVRIQEGASGLEVARELLWPVLRMIDQLARAEQLSDLAFRYASEALRLVVARLSLLPRNEAGENLGFVIVCSGGEPVAEIAGQLIAECLEQTGFTVAFAAGGVPVEDLLQDVSDRRPVAVVIFAAGPSEAPMVRELIDRIRDIDACPDLRIFAGGGVFARAEGLAEEVGAEAGIDDPFMLLDRLTSRRRSRTRSMRA